MIKDKYQLTQFDTGPDLIAYLEDADENPIDLTYANSVLMDLRGLTDGTVNMVRTCTIVNATAGEITYLPTGVDTAKTGVWRGRFIVNYVTGQSVSFPNNDYFIFTIVPD